MSFSETLTPKNNKLFEKCRLSRITCTEEEKLEREGGRKRERERDGKGLDACTRRVRERREKEREMGK